MNPSFVLYPLYGVWRFIKRVYRKGYLVWGGGGGGRVVVGAPPPMDVPQGGYLVWKRIPTAA